MANRKTIRSRIIACLPHAEGNLIDFLAGEVKKELSHTWGRKKHEQHDQNALVEQIIKREELAELGLKNDSVSPSLR